MSFSAIHGMKEQRSTIDAQLVTKRHRPAVPRYFAALAGDAEAGDIFCDEQQRGQRLEDFRCGSVLRCPLVDRQHHVYVHVCQDEQ